MSEHRIDLKRLESIRDGSGHSIFGASGSSMFLNCPGSLIPNLLAEDNAGEDAAYGTVAHAVGEEWRRSGRKPVELLGTNRFVPSGEWGYLIWIDEVMMDYVSQSVGWSSMLPGDHLVEVRVDYSDLTPIKKQGGTLDFAAMMNGRAYVQDEKYGKNDLVLAEENTQLMLYAYGIYREWGWLYGFKEFVLRISQPRKDNFDEWVCSRERLLEFAAWAKERMALAWSPDASRIPGPKQCRWCKVRGTCAAAAKLENDLISEVFSDLMVEYNPDDIRSFKDELDIGMVKPTLDLMTLSIEQMVTLKRYRKFSDAFWKALETELNRRAIVENQKIPGMKLVEGRSHRVFAKPKVAAQRLIELGCDEKNVVVESVVSPAEAEKLLRKAGHRNKDLPELLEGLVRRPPGKPTLVFLSDKRPELQDVSADVFADLVDESDDTETD